MRLSPLKDSGTAGFASVGRGDRERRTGLAPRWRPTAVRMPAVMSTSPTSGTLVMVLGPCPRMAATMCLVTAFLEPRTSTSPRSGPAGSMSQASDTQAG